MRTLFATVAVLVLAVISLAWATDGFRAVTAEGARRLAIAEHPAAVPDVALVDMQGRALTLADYRGRVLLVEFIYSTCPTLCLTLGESFADALEAVRARGAGTQAALLSISFDLERDTPEALRDYAERHGADGRIWRIARPTTRRDLRALLSTFGVTVIPDPPLGFQHNAAIHVVDESGKLVRILDVAADQAIEAMVSEMGRL
ncbi:MAG: SCO family protein [Methyloligellaceae bacterium]